jgi:Ca2+-dependent lipid-binding protein
VLRFSQP